MDFWEYEDIIHDAVYEIFGLEPEECTISTRVFILNFYFTETFPEEQVLWEFVQLLEQKLKIKLRYTLHPTGHAAQFYEKPKIVGKFYGLAVEYMLEQDSIDMDGPFVLFELIPTSELGCFLGDSEQPSLKYGAEPYRSVIEAYRSEGLQGQSFLRGKAELLANTVTYYYYMRVNNAELPYIDIGSWYLISMLSDSAGSGASTDYGTLLDEELQNRVVSTVREELSPLTQEKLREIFSIYQTDDDEEEQANDITANTEVSRVCIYNMGQALCVGIFNEAGALTATFDFGLPYVASRAIQNLATDFQNFINDLKGVFPNDRSRGNITVILSHWHMDHCIMATLLGGELLHHTKWIVPSDGLGVAAQKVRHHIQNCQGSVRTVSDDVVDTAVNACRNICFGKINLRVPGKNTSHPHHHGIYLRIRTQADSTIFLAGDCTYKAINQVVRENSGAGYTFLQASHHGGDYALRPADRDISHIPCPAQGGVVIYSAGPYSKHHHPSGQSDADYNNCGWTAQHNTHTDGTINLT